MTKHEQDLREAYVIGEIEGRLSVLKIYLDTDNLDGAKRLTEELIDKVDKLVELKREYANYLMNKTE